MKRISIFTLALVFLFALSPNNGFAVRSGGTFVFIAPYGGDIGTLDPHKTARVQDGLIMLNIYRTLYKWDPVKGEPVPALAEKVDQSADGLVYTYHLRKGVKFHNGRELTADDIIWSYNRIMNPNTASPSARWLVIIKGAKEVEDGKEKQISGLKKIDDYTLEITLDGPFNPGYAFYEPRTSILPREEVEKRGDAFGTEPVGCGPFEVEKIVRGSEVSLKRFPGYYETGKPYLDKLVYKIMVEDGTRDMAFKAKELDATIVGPTHYPEYKKSPEFSKYMVEVDEMYTIMAGFNLEYEPFRNKLVRQAINYAVDRPLILEKLLKNKGTLATGWLSTSQEGFDPKAKGYEYNIEKAKALMKKAGYEKGFTVECLGTANKSWGIPVVEAMIPYLKKINITLKPQQLEGAAMVGAISTGEFQMFIWCIISGPDPIVSLKRWTSSKPRTLNYMRYNNPEYDKILDLASHEVDYKKRIELIRKVDRILQDDAPIWFFAYNGAALAHQPWVHGLQPVAVEMMYQDFTNVWIEASSPRAYKK
jgi:peptide/nickel transport system substrate-binding protein